MVLTFSLHFKSSISNEGVRDRLAKDSECGFLNDESFLELPIGRGKLFKTDVACMKGWLEKASVAEVA